MWRHIGQPILTYLAARSVAPTKRPARFSVLCGAGLGILVAILLLSLAVPRLVFALRLLPGEEAVDLIRSGTRPSDAGLIRAIDAQHAALATMSRADVRMDVAYLAQALAESPDTNEADRAQLVSLANGELGQSLALAPGNPRGWMMLAGTRLNAGDRDGAAKALTVSFSADPHVPLLAPFRWALALAVGKQLSRETREWANLEFLSYFRLAPEMAVRQALRRQQLAALTALASDSGEDRDRLERILKRMRYGGAGT